MRGLLCFLLIFNLVEIYRAENVLTDAMKNGLTKLGEACTKSVGATEEDVNSLRKGPPYTGKGACVLACIFTKANIMEKKTFSKKGFMFAVTPFLITEPKKLKRMDEISTECDREIIKSNENECEVANHIVICLRKHIPQIAEIKF